VPGISNVVTRGGRSKEFVIIPNPVKMSTLGITPAAVSASFASNNFVLSNGNLADFRRLYLTLTDTRVMDADALANLTIRNDGTRLIKLRDFATVDIQQQQEFVVINANGKNSVQIDLVKQPGINLIDFAKMQLCRLTRSARRCPKVMNLRYIMIKAFLLATVSIA
jgi:cobalt-zinc-cadmium resistance protein CzcA